MENANIFGEMVKLQHKFNQNLGEDYLDYKFNWNNAIIDESSELLTSLGYKWWKKQDFDEQNVKLEAIDLLHFVISEQLQTSYSYDKEYFIGNTAHFFRKYFTSTNEDEILAYGDNMKNGIAELINHLNYNDSNRFHILKLIFIALGMSNEEIYVAYIVKNCLNKFRQDNGYKEGTYIKEWGKVEDNVIAYELANRLVVDESLFENLIYSLNSYYKIYVKDIAVC